MELQDPPAGSQHAAPLPTVAAAPTWSPDEPVTDTAPTASSSSEALNDRPVRIPARVFRWVAVAAAALALGLTGWQTARILDDQEWSGSFAGLALVSSIVAAVGLLAWTWVIVENARRLLVIASTHAPPDPKNAVAAWFAPLIVAGAAGAAVVFLQARLREDASADASPVPLAVALVSIVVTLMVMYRPIYVLSAVTRRLGSASVDLAKWFWVPIALAIVGSLSLVVLNLGGAYGEDFDGLVPAWALGVVAIPPTVIVLALAWRGGSAVEDAVSFAFARRSGEVTAGIGRGRMGFMARALRADARPPIARDMRRHIRLIPATEILRLVVVTMIAALALLSIVGAIIMFLFWREASDGFLLQSQQDRAWDALGSLQRVERMIALAVLVAASVWSFVTVMNARLATGRRRNPFLAALAWPVAAFGIWRVADGVVVDDDRVATIIGGFALQAVILFLPFFLLERAAVAVGAQRQPIRFAYGLGVILLVHTQGLVGLSTLDTGVATDQFGRIAGYLGLAALLQLLSTLTITEASQLISDGARNEADRHNFLAQQRRDVEQRSSVRDAALAVEADAGEVADAGPGSEATDDTTTRPAASGAAAPTVIAASSPPQL